MNINYIFYILKKNLIFIAIFLTIFSYYFYSAYSDIIEKHPKYNISSTWASNYHPSFEDLNLIATSMNSNYKIFLSSINNIIKGDNKTKLAFANLEEFNNRFPDINFLKFYDSFNVFRFENIEFFYHQELLRNINQLNNLTVFSKIINEKVVTSLKPFNAKIVLSATVGDNYLNDLKQIDQLMINSNLAFNKKKLHSLIVFFNWLENEIKNTVEVIENSFNLSSETSENFDIVKKYAIANLQIYKKRASLIFEGEGFSLFVKSNESILKLEDEIMIKILSNLVGHLFAFIFVVSIFIFCREIITENLKQRKNFKN